MAGRKPKAGAESIGGILSRVLRQAGLEESLENSRILKLWSSAVGRSVAAHASPRSFRLGKLLVTVDSSAWHAELERYFKKKIIENLNQKLGKPLIKSLAFRVGEVEAADGSAPGSTEKE
jgi:predicted nucleic acid-binding Zn ribbon protein